MTRAGPARRSWLALLVMACAACGGGGSGGGIVDLVAATPDADQLWLLPQQAAQRGSFAPARSLGTPRLPYASAAGDLDGDGRADLAAALNSVSPGGVAVLLQDAQWPGDFRQAVQVAMPAGGRAVAIADVDRDGRADLLLASAADDPARAGLYLALQDAQVAGTFRPATRLDAGEKPRHVVASDLDADGRIDIAVAASVTGLVNDLQAVVQLFLQDPAQPGRYLRGGRYPAGDLVEYLAAADLDRDGHVDLVTGEGPSVLYADPAQPGRFAAPATL